MKINYKGKEYEAYRLIMRKENALEILNGTKRLEIRNWTDKYNSDFFDKEKLAKFEHDKERGAEVGTDIFIEDCLKDVTVAYFTNYNHSWHLVVELLSIGINSLTKEDIEYLNEEFDFHDLDNEWQQYADAKDEDIPSFFTLELGRILEHSGLEYKSSR